MIIAISAISGTSIAQESAISQRPLARASKLVAVPVIDGDVLNDPAWEAGVPITGFTQIRPNEGQPATQRTEVFVGFTDSAMYVGVVAFDDDPSGILVTDSRRDSSLDDTDAFLFIVDGLLDRQNGFVFGTNPAGMEFDGQVVKEASGRFSAGGGGFNQNWDGSWTVRAKTSAFGWSAEFEIPLRTLRFGTADEQAWGFNFQRNIRRNYEVAFWSPLDRQRNLYRVSEAGTIEGIRVPRQRNLQVTPYVLGKMKEGGGRVSKEEDAEFGVDLKYSITPSLTLDATYNTDFAQVEVDEQMVNLDRFSMFFPEKRPFFLENAGQFSVGNSREVELFFSRRIGISEGDQIPIEGGLRLSGKVGPSTNIGLLHMESESIDGITSGSNYSVARINQELPNRSGIGVLFVNRQGDGSYLAPGELDENQTYAIDGRWGIGENLQLQAWFAKTETPYLHGDDAAFSLKAGYESQSWAYRLEHTEVGGDFNPEVGFLSRKEYEKDSVFVMYKYRPDDLWGLLELRPHARYSEYRDAVSGLKESSHWHIDNHWEYKNGYLLETGGNLSYERVQSPFEIVPGVIIPEGVYDHGEAALVARTNQAAPLSLNLRMTSGGAWGGDKFHASPTIRFRIGETFSSELSYNYNKFDLPFQNGNFDVSLVRLRLSYSFTPRILLQALVQHNNVSDTFSTNLRFSWLQSANAGFFVVYNEVDERGIGAPPRGREFIVKYSQIFDVFD